MGIGIKGIRIGSVNIPDQDTKGLREVSGSYELISTADKVLATQTVNGYGNMKLSMSPATVKAMDAFLASFKADITTLIGLEGVEQ